MGTVNHRSGMDTSRGLSGFWAYMPAELRTGEDPSLGIFEFDDFTNTPDFAATDSDLHKYATYGDTGTTVTSLATEPQGTDRAYGVMVHTHDGTDNDAIYMRGGGATGVFATITDTTNENVRVWFECRYQQNNVTDDVLNIFIGLTAEVALSATASVLTDDTGATKLDAVGFRTLSGDGNGLDSIYATAGTEVVHKNEAQVTLVDTWYKLGIYYDGTGVYYYVDGVQIVPTTAGGAADGVGILPAATSFPDDEELHIMLASKITTAVAATVSFDWVAYGCTSYVST